MAIALNLCVREQLLRKKGNKYTVAAKGKRFTGVDVDDEPTEQESQEDEGIKIDGSFPAPELTAHL